MINPKIRRVAANAPLAAATGTRSLANDPLTFAIQVARRFPGLRRPVVAAARRLRGAEAALLRTWLAGDLVATREALDELTGSKPLGRIAAEIAQAAGRPELVVDDPDVAPVTRARASWLLGEMTEAIDLLTEHAPNSRLHRSLLSERSLMTPGTRLPWRLGSSTWAGQGSGVLHLLTNSLPHTQSGYTMRSHAVLLAQREVGLRPVAMTRVGYPVVVGALDAAAVDSSDGIVYHRALPRVMAATPEGRLAQQADAFSALASQMRPAALQTTTHYPNAVVVREVAEALGVPWTYEVRGMLEQTWVSSLATDAARERAMHSARFRLTREREAELASAADAMFTLSAGMQDDLADRGVPRERIHLVPNAIDPALLARAHVDPADAREALGLPREGFWVGSTSSLVEYEGFDVLLEAARLARTDGVDVRVLLVGDGTARSALEAQAAAIGAEAVQMIGRVDRSRVADYRDALDAVIVPRLDRTVTRTVSPLKPVEAMAAGRPLLVSALPPLLEAIGAELVGLGAAVPPGSARALADRIEQLAGDAQLRASLSAAGRARATHLTWPAVGATYRRAYAKIWREPSV